MIDDDDDGFPRNAQNMLLNFFLPKSTVSAQNQTTKGLFKNSLTNKLYAALNWLLLVKKSSHWGIKIIKTEIKMLMHSFHRYLNPVKPWYFKCWRLLVECIWFKYPRSMPTEIKTTLKLSHQSTLKCRNALAFCSISKLTDTVGLEICSLKMLRVCFYLKFKMSNG